MSHSPQRLQGMYFGNRGPGFKDLIASVLSLGKLSKSFTKILLRPASMELFGQAFTSDTVDPVKNYQCLEQIGDLAANMSIVNYVYARYPQLNVPEGVKVAARCRIKYASKDTFYEIGSGLGLLPFISASKEMRKNDTKDLVEDVFEAFFGAVCTILDDMVAIGAGYGATYKIVSTIFDGMEMSLRYESLYDAKTRLKELFDFRGRIIGALKYEDDKNDEGVSVTTAYRIEDPVFFQRRNGSFDRNRITGGTRIKIGYGHGPTKSEAQQIAAENAIEFLRSQGHYKHPPAVYRRFAQGDDSRKTLDVTVKTITEEWDEGVNSLKEIKTVNRSARLSTTPLGKYCRERNTIGIKACLKIEGVDPNIVDSDGFFPLDRLFIGAITDDVKKICKRIVKYSSEPVKISSEVFSEYMDKYEMDKYMSKVSVVGDSDSDSDSD
jgi:dsRNA-specific ribonuclease